LKKGSPLGVEPQGEGIKGASGYSTGSEGAQATTVADDKAATVANDKAASVAGGKVMTVTNANVNANAATQTAAPVVSPAATPTPAKDAAKEDKDALKEAAKVEVKEQAANTSPELPPAGNAARLAVSDYFNRLAGAHVASVKVAAKQ
jgi:hypothetical protein